MVVSGWKFINIVFNFQQFVFNIFNRAYHGSVEKHEFSKIFEKPFFAVFPDFTMPGHFFNTFNIHYDNYDYLKYLLLWGI